MLIILAPNSTPIVKSWTGWKRLSVNWSRRHDLPTPTNIRRFHKQKSLPVSPIIIYLKRYEYDILSLETTKEGVSTILALILSKPQPSIKRKKNHTYKYTISVYKKRCSFSVWDDTRDSYVTFSECGCKVQN